jgi:hypothetical protein
MGDRSRGTKARRFSNWPPTSAPDHAFLSRALGLFYQHHTAATTDAEHYLSVAAATGDRRFTTGDG